MTRAILTNLRPLGGSLFRATATLLPGGSHEITLEARAGRVFMTKPYPPGLGGSDLYDLSTALHRLRLDPSDTRPRYVWACGHDEPDRWSVVVDLRRECPKCRAKKKTPESGGRDLFGEGVRALHD